MNVLHTLQQADLRLFARLFNQGRRRLVVPLARAISRSGDGYLHVLLPLIVWLSGSASAGDLSRVLLLSVAVERVVYWSIKNSLRRRRPADYMPEFESVIIASDRFSFPSGHTSCAFLLATTCTLTIGAPVAALYLWATAVGLSRVVLGVHFPGDTVAGALMGSGIAMGCAAWVGAW